MSEHPSLAYTGEFYANMLIGFLRDVVGRPAVVLGHGRAANIAVRAAADAPDLFTRLVLIAPDVEAGVELEPKPSQLLSRATQRVSLGLVPYAFLSTKPLLRRLAQRRSALSGETSAGEDTVQHLYASAHQFGGQHALLALMTGELDLPIQNVFPLLQPPVLLISGDEDPERPVEVMEDLAILNPHADLDVLTSAGEAAFEDQPAMFTEALLDWLATAPGRQRPQVEEEQPTEYLEVYPATSEIPVLTEETETIIILEAPDTADDTVGAADTSESVLSPADKPAGMAMDEPTEQPPEQSEARPRSAPTSRTAQRATGASLSASVDKPNASKSAQTGAGRPQRATRQARQSATPRLQSEARTTKKAASGKASGQQSGAKNANGPSADKPSGKGSARKSSRATRNTNPNSD
jgi:pimeloyl-ACP methyl ester carboxylesterase